MKAFKAFDLDFTITHMEIPKVIVVIESVANNKKIGNFKSGV